MTEFLSIQEAMDKGSGEVSVHGWVHRERGSSKIKFIVLRDASNIIQCVLKRDAFSDDEWATIDAVQVEASVEITGEIKPDERAPTGFELLVRSFTVVGPSDTFPITKDQSPEFLLDNRHLWLRSRKMTAILKIRHTVVGAIHEFFRTRGYYEFHPPIFTPNACEGGSTLFEVKYYDDVVYLTQSWQLYAEAAVFSLGKVYDVSPTFRSEKSKTSRHLSEFWMCEMEAAWMNLQEVTEVAKEEIRFIISKVLEENAAELEILGRDASVLKAYVEKEYPTITYTEALRVLKEKGGMDVEWGKDLRTVEEEELMKHFDTPVVVIEYPKAVMAFYKPEKKLRPGVSGDDATGGAPGPVALCFDMLAPEGYGEIVGGSQRDTSLEDLKKGLEGEGEEISNYEWYLDLRRYGSVPHSGYGVGLERVLAWICGSDNIKDTVAFPRTMLRKRP